MEALIAEIHAHPYLSLGLLSLLVATSPLMSALRSVARKVGEKALALAGKLVITSIELNDVSTAEVVCTYLAKTGQTHSVGGDCYDVVPQRAINGAMKHIFYRKVADSLTLYFYKGAPILITPIGRDGEGGQIKRAQVRFLNGTVDMTALLIEAADYVDEMLAEEARTQRAFAITTISPDANNGGVTVSVAALDSSNTLWKGDGSEPVHYNAADFARPPTPLFSHRLSFTDAHRQLFQDVRFWKENKQWYVDAELEYKRGYMIHGAPGTGKSSLISAIAQDLDIPVVIINLSGMTDSQFLRAWGQALNVSIQRIVLFEDFDTVFQGRKNVSGTLNFTTVLNAIDGIQGSSGTLLFITTNHIQHIDEAIGRPDKNGDSTRAGRIDVIIELPELDYEGRLKICKRILKTDEEAKAMAGSSPKEESPSRLTERCKRRALQMLWDQKR